jgi:phosphoenolpyruvate carboxylase
MQDMARIVMKNTQRLKAILNSLHLQDMSTLNYYAKANIGSRPSKRNKGNELNFGDLRAIPFVGSWAQMKQMFPVSLVWGMP